MRSSPIPVSMFCDGQLRQRAVRPQLVLHEDEVPELEKALGVVARAVALRAEGETPVEVELGARPAGPRRP